MKQTYIKALCPEPDGTKKLWTWTGHTQKFYKDLIKGLEKEGCKIV